jgi:exodeoxyribonuclease V alpha subunit
MQVANEYEKEVFKGDLGTVETIDADARELPVRYPSGEAGGL